MIVNQNRLLQVLMSEENFSSHCGNLYTSNLFGEDLSQLVDLQRTQAVKTGSQALDHPGNSWVTNYKQQQIRQALETNFNSSTYIREGEQLLMPEVSAYLEANRKEIEANNLEVVQEASLAQNDGGTTRLEEHPDKNKDAGTAKPNV